MNEVVRHEYGLAPGASIPQVAAMYQVSEGLLYRLANEGKLPGCRRLGGDDGGRGRFVIHLETFEGWLASGMGDENLLRQMQLARREAQQEQSTQSGPGDLDVGQPKPG